MSERADETEIIVISDSQSSDSCCEDSDFEILPAEDSDGFVFTPTKRYLAYLAV